MVSETTPVNVDGKDLTTFGGRLVAERQRLHMKQVDVCVLGGVSKTTQIKYEANERRPDSDYLERLDRRGFDVMYLLTGQRSAGAVTPEHQNLIEAFEGAGEPVKQAVFAALLAQASNAVRNRVESARKVPGYYQHELKGERDVRYQAWADGGGKDRPVGSAEVEVEPLKGPAELPGELKKKPTRPRSSGTR